MEDLLSSMSYVHVYMHVHVHVLHVHNKDIHVHVSYYSSTVVSPLSVYEELGNGVKVTVELLLNDTQAAHDDSVETITLGTISVSDDCSWIMMDTKICDIFQVQI